MSSKEITEHEVEAFLTKLKASDNDKKVDQIQFFGFELEQVSSLPESTFDAITQSMAPLLRTSSQLLVTSTLSHFLILYLPLLPIAPIRHLQLTIIQLLPALLEKLNDPKERIHSASASCIGILGRKSYEAEPPSATPSLSGSGKGREKETLSQTWERSLKEVMVGKGTRGKLETVKLLASMRAEEGSRLPLKPWLAPLVDLLEDGDGPVREQAREAIVAMLSPTTTPSAAKTELKKLLVSRNVRKTIADPIISRIFAGSGSVPSSAPATTSENAANGIEGSEPAASGTVTPVASDVPVVHIASPRDLEGEFAQMLPHFEGKETEHNWGPREKSIVRVRGMLKGNTHQQFREAYVAGLKSGIMEGFLRTADYQIQSLRTTVAQQACAVMQDLPEALGSSFDPFVEGVLPVLGKMAGLTKKLIADKSQRALVSIISHTTCHPRLYLTHVTSGITDKNVQIRHFSASHLKVVLDVHGERSKTAIESTAGLQDTLDTAIKKGLGDVNPAVRELSREAFWSYNRIWPSRGKAISEGLDPQARKQLEKVNPAGAASGSGSAPLAETTRPAAPKRATTVSAMIAERKRLAKAAEAAAANAENLGSPRVVSGPIPSSPSIPQGSQTQRSVSSVHTTPLKGRMTRSITSPAASPILGATTKASSSKTATTPTPKQPSVSKMSTTAAAESSSQHAISRSRSSSLARTLSKSPPPTQSSPSVRSSLRRQSSQRDGGDSTRSSSAATMDSLRTPTLKRKPIPSYTQNGVGLGISNNNNQNAGSPSRAAGVNSGAGAGAGSSDSIQQVVEDARRAQADQAISAAEQLLTFDEPESNTGPVPEYPSASTLGPVTPARSTLGPHRNGSRDHLLRTPINGNGSGARGKNIWEDSPRNQAVTPLFLEKLKGRKYERSWWARQQQLLDKASPLKQSSEGSGSASSLSVSIQADLTALESGQPSIRNLQKLGLFAAEHSVSTETDDEEEYREIKRVWDEERLFERIYESLLVILHVQQPENLLEQALVLLWEMIQHQWPLFEDRESSLMDALFRLRASSNHTILESTYSLLSLLATATDHLILLGIIRSSLDTFVAKSPLPSTTNGHPASAPTDSTNPPSVQDLSLNSPPSSSSSSSQTQTSGYIFALNGIGMCILRLPPPVVLVEASRLEPLITTCLSSDSITVRQAANTLILAIQCVLGDSAVTLGLFPRLSTMQRNLATYLMETNGLQGRGKGQVLRGEEEEEQKERVMGEMDGLMSRSMA